MIHHLFRKGRENVNKKLLTIAIVLIVLAMVATPVAATLPATSPLPKGNGWESVWGLLKDLQNQIKNIQLTPGLQGPPGPQGPPGADGTCTGCNIAMISGVRDNNGPTPWPGISTPPGFTTAQCKFIIDVNEIRCPKEYTLEDIKTGYTILGPNLFDVYALGSCRINDILIAIPEIQKANYVVICQK
jgi:hypothetical protein